MNNEKNKTYSWIILMIVCLAIFSASYTQYQLSPISQKIMEVYSLSNSEFTSVFSAPMIPAVFLSLVSGLLVDRFGIKIVVGIGVFITAIGTILRIGAGEYSVLFISMLMTGFGATFLNSNITKILGEWFSKERISRVMGLFLASSTLGMTIGMGTTAMFKSVSSAFILAAVISVIVPITWIAFVKNNNSNKNEEDKIPIMNCLKVVVKSHSLWMVGFSLMFTLGANIVISSFMPATLISRGIDSVYAGIYSSMITVGCIIGSIIAPRIALKFKSTKILIFSFSIISAIFISFSWRVSEGLPLIACLLITGITIGGVIPVLMSAPVYLKEIGRTYAGTAGGFIGTLQLLGAVVIPTYIIVPIAGINTSLLFILTAICMVVVCLISFILPNFYEKENM